MFLVEGKRAVAQIERVSPRSIGELLATDSAARDFSPGTYPVRMVTERQFGAISSSKTPQGVAAVVIIPPDSFSGELPGNIGNRLLLLEEIQDPGNVGTLVRTAAGFGFSGLIMSSSCADPFSPKAVGASAGSVLSVWIRRTDRYLECIDELRRKKYSLIAADVRGESLTPKFWTPRHIVALGNEGGGLSEKILEKADDSVQIPMDDKKVESLNVAVSGAILMFLSSQS